MKPIPSILKIIDFSVLQMDFEFIVPDNLEDAKSPSAYFEEYELDLDFLVLEVGYLQIVMTVNINNVANPLPGYKISAQVGTLFQIGESNEITPEQRKSIEGFSTVYMALNNLRGVIAGFTANAPCGRYTLPSIDLNDLIRKKMEMGTNPDSEDENSKKKTKPKKKK